VINNLLYGISKFPLIYVSSPQGERMEVRGLSSGIGTALPVLAFAVLVAIGGRIPLQNFTP